MPDVENGCSSHANGCDGTTGIIRPPLHFFSVELEHAWANRNWSDIMEGLYTAVLAGFWHPMINYSVFYTYSAAFFKTNANLVKNRTYYILI